MSLQFIHLIVHESQQWFNNDCKRIVSIAAESNQIGMVVVDECHCVTTWGYSFRHSYLKIGHYISGLDSEHRHPYSER